MISPDATNRKGDGTLVQCLIKGKVVEDVQFMARGLSNNPREAVKGPFLKVPDQHDGFFNGIMRMTTFQKEKIHPLPSANSSFVELEHDGSGTDQTVFSLSSVAKYDQLTGEGAFEILRNQTNGQTLFLSAKVTPEVKAARIKYLTQRLQGKEDRNEESIVKFDELRKALDAANSPPANPRPLSAENKQEKHDFRFPDQNSFLSLPFSRRDFMDAFFDTSLPNQENDHSLDSLQTLEPALDELYTSILQFVNIVSMENKRTISMRDFIHVWLCSAPVLIAEPRDSSVNTRWMAFENTISGGTRIRLDPQYSSLQANGNNKPYAGLYLYARRQPGSSILDHMYGGAVQIRAIASLSVQNDNGFDFLCAKKGFDDGPDSSTVIDEVSKASFYLVNAATRKSIALDADNEAKRLKHEVREAHRAYKKLDSVYPLSLIHAIKSIPHGRGRYRFFLWCAWVWLVVFAIVLVAIPVNQEVVIVPLNSSLPVKLSLAQCDLTLHTLPKSSSSRVWPSWFQLYALETDKTLFAESDMVVTTTMGSLMTADLEVHRNWYRADVSRFGGGSIRVENNEITIVGRDLYVMAGRCQVHLYVDSRALSFVPGITIVGTGYTYRSPLVIERSDDERAGSVVDGVWRSLEVNATGLHLKLGSMIFDSIKIVATSGTVSFHDTVVRNNADVRLGLNFKTGQMCKAGLGLPIGHKNRSFVDAYANGTTANTSSHQYPEKEVGCAAAGGDVYLGVKNDVVHVTAKQLENIVCLSAPVANDIGLPGNGTRHSLLCTNETVCSMTPIPTIYADVFDGGVYINLATNAENSTSDAENSTIEATTLAGIDTNPFLGPRSLDRVGRAELKAINRWLDEEPSRDHLVWIPVTMNGKRFSFWWASRRIFIEFRAYLFDIFSVGFLAPKFRKAPVRLVPGFCPSGVTQNMEHLPAAYGGVISNVIQKAISSDIGSALVAQTVIEDAIEGNSFEYLQQAGGIFEVQSVALRKNVVLIAAALISLLISLVGAFSGVFLTYWLYHKFLSDYREFLVTKIKTGRELIRADQENEILSNVSEVGLKFSTAVKENETRALTLSYFQLSELALSGYVASQLSVDSVTTFFSRCKYVECINDDKSIVAALKAAFGCGKPIISSGGKESMEEEELMLTSVEARYRQWCIEQGQEIRNLKDSQIKSHLLQRFNVKCLSHMMDCFVGVRWWNVARDGAKVDRNLEYYKGSVSMYFLGTETQVSPLSTDYVSAEELEKRYKLFCADRSLITEVFRPEDLEALNIARRRLSVEYIKGVRLLTNADLENRKKRKIFVFEGNSPAIWARNLVRKMSRLREECRRSLFHFLSSSVPEKISGLLSSSFVLSIVHICQVFIPPLPLLIIVFYTQESYMKYSGNHHHAGEKSLIGLSDWSGIFFGPDFIGVFLSVFMPHSSVFVLLAVLYWSIGTAYLLGFYANMYVPQPFAKEEILLGGTPLHDEKHLDSAIELVFHHHETAFVSGNGVGLVIRVIFNFFYFIIYGWFFKLAQLIIRNGCHCRKLHQAFTNQLDAMKADELYIFRQRLATKTEGVSNGKAKVRQSINAVKITLASLLHEHSIYQSKVDLETSPLKMILRTAEENNPLVLSREKGVYEGFVHACGASLQAVFYISSMSLLGIYLFYVTLVLVWFIIGAIVNPTQMLPFAATVVAVSTFVTAKVATLKQLLEETRGTLRNIVKEELQQVMSNSELDLLGIDMSEKVLSAFVTGDTTTLAKTSMSVDVIHDTILPLKSQITRVCDELDIDEATIKALASGNTDEIARVSLEKLNLDPNLALLIINIIRKDFKVAESAFRVLAKTVMGKDDPQFLNFCSAILKIMATDDASAGQGVIEKKIVSKLLLYLGQQSDISIPGNLSAEFIYTFINLSERTDATSMFGVLQILVRWVEDKIEEKINMDGDYRKPFVSLVNLCKHFFRNSGSSSKLCESTETLSVMKPLIIELVLLWSKNTEEEAEQSAATVFTCMEAIVEVSAGNTYPMKKLLVQKVQRQVAASQRSALLNEETDLLMDIVEAGIAVLSQSGALESRSRILRVVEKLSQLKSYQTIVRKRYGVSRAHALNTATIWFASNMFPFTSDFAADVSGLNFSHDVRLNIKAFGSVVKELKNGNEAAISVGGVPLSGELRRRGHVIVDAVVPLLKLDDVGRSTVKAFVLMLVGSRESFDKGISKLLDTVSPSEKTKRFLTTLLTRCLHVRSERRGEVINGEQTRQVLNTNILVLVRHFWAEEKNAGRLSKLRSTLEPFLYEYCERIYNCEINDLEKMKGLTTEWDISVLEDFQRIHGLVVAILNAMKSTTITQKRVSTILKLIFNFMVIPASQFESRPLEPKLILQSADYKTLSSILDVSSEIITVVLQMLLFRHSLNSTALFTRETLAAFNIPFSAFKELEKAKFLPMALFKSDLQAEAEFLLNLLKRNGLNENLKDSVVDENQFMILVDIMQSTSKLAHSVALQASKINGNDDYEGISQLIQVLVTKCQIMIPQITRRLKESGNTREKRENIRIYEARLKLFNIVLDIVAIVGGLISPRVKEDSRQLVDKIVDKIKQTVPGQDFKPKIIENTFNKLSWSGHWKLFKFGIIALVDYSRNIRSKFNDDKSDYIHSSKSLIVALQYMLQELTGESYNKGLEHMNGLLLLGSIQGETVGGSKEDAMINENNFISCFRQVCNGYRDRLQAKTIKYCDTIDVTSFECLLSTRNFNNTRVSPEAFLRYLAASAAHNRKRMISGARAVCKQLGMSPEKIDLGLSLLGGTRFATTHLFKKAQELHLRSSVCLGLAGMVRLTEDFEKNGYPALAELLGFPDHNVLRGFVHLLRAGDFSDGSFVALGSALRVDPMLLTLLCTSKLQYKAHHSSSGELIEGKLNRFLQSYKPHKNYNAIVSSIYMICNGNEDVLQRVLSLQEDDGLSTANANMQNILEKRGSLESTLLRARFATEHSSCKTAMRELFCDFAPFSFFNPEEMRRKEKNFDIFFPKTIFKHIKRCDAVDMARTWLTEIVFSNRSMFSETDMKAQVKLAKIAFLKDAKRLANLLRSKLKWSFENESDPSSLLNSNRAEKSEIDSDPLEAIESLSFLSYPMAMNMDNIFLLSKRVNQDFFKMISDVVLQFCVSMKGWKGLHQRHSSTGFKFYKCYAVDESGICQVVPKGWPKPADELQRMFLSPSDTLEKVEHEMSKYGISKYYMILQTSDDGDDIDERKERSLNLGLFPKHMTLKSVESSLRMQPKLDNVINNHTNFIVVGARGSKNTCSDTGTVTEADSDTHFESSTEEVYKFKVLNVNFPAERFDTITLDLAKTDHASRTKHVWKKLKAQNAKLLSFGFIPIESAGSNYCVGHKPAEKSIGCEEFMGKSATGVVGYSHSILGVDEKKTGTHALCYAGRRLNKSWDIAPDDSHFFQAKLNKNKSAITFLVNDTERNTALKMSLDETDLGEDLQSSFWVPTISVKVPFAASRGSVVDLKNMLRTLFSREHDIQDQWSFTSSPLIGDSHHLYRSLHTYLPVFDTVQIDAGGDERPEQGTAETFEGFYYQAQYKKSKESPPDASIGFDAQILHVTDAIPKRKKSFYFLSNGQVWLPKQRKYVSLREEWVDGATVGAGWNTKTDAIFFTYEDDKNSDGKTYWTVFENVSVEWLIPNVFYRFGGEFDTMKVREPKMLSSDIKTWLVDEGKKGENIYSEQRLFDRQKDREVGIHPKNIQTVLNDVISIMLPSNDERNDVVTLDGNEEKYRSTMFLGDDGEYSVDSHLFWDLASTRRTFSGALHLGESSATRQKQFQKSFFSVLKPFGIKSESRPPSSTRDYFDKYWTHEDGWYKSICWNECSRHSISTAHSALKDWSLAVSWQFIEIGTRQLATWENESGSKTIGLLHFEDYVCDIIDGMKSTMGLDSSDEEEDSADEALISERNFRIKGLLERFPVARAYCIATTLSNLTRDPNLGIWGTASQDGDLDWYTQIANATDDLPRLINQRVTDHFPPSLCKLVDPLKDFNFSNAEQRETNMLLRFMLAGDTSVLENTAIVNTLVTLIQRKTTVKIEALQDLAAAMSVPARAIVDLCGLITGNSQNFKRFMSYIRVDDFSARQILDDGVRAIWKNDWSVSKAFDHIFMSSSFWCEDQNPRNLRKYETLLICALGEGYPNAISFIADRVFADGFNEFRRLNAGENFGHNKKDVEKIISQSKQIYEVFISFAVHHSKGAGENLEMVKEFATSLFFEKKSLFPRPAKKDDFRVFDENMTKQAIEAASICMHSVGNIWRGSMRATLLLNFLDSVFMIVITELTAQFGVPSAAMKYILVALYYLNKGHADETADSMCKFVKHLLEGILDKRSSLMSEVLGLTENIKVKPSHRKQIGRFIDSVTRFSRKTDTYKQSLQSNGIIKMCMDSELNYAVPHAVFRVIKSLWLSDSIWVSDDMPLNSMVRTADTFVKCLSQAVIKLRCRSVGSMRYTRPWLYRLRHPSTKPHFGELYDIMKLLRPKGMEDTVMPKDNAAPSKTIDMLRRITYSEIMTLVKLASVSHEVGKIPITPTYKDWENNLTIKQLGKRDLKASLLKDNSGRYIKDDMVNVDDVFSDWVDKEISQGSAPEILLDWMEKKDVEFELNFSTSIWCLAASGDTNLVVAGSEEEVVIANTMTGKLIKNGSFEVENDAAEAINISPVFVDGQRIESCYVCYGDGCVINLVQVKKMKVNQGTEDGLLSEFKWTVKKDGRSSSTYDSRVLDISFINTTSGNGDSMTLVFCTEEFVYVYSLNSFIGFNETDHLEIDCSDYFSVVYSTALNFSGDVLAIGGKQADGADGGSKGFGLVKLYSLKIMDFVDTVHDETGNPTNEIFPHAVNFVTFSSTRQFFVAGSRGEGDGGDGCIIRMYEIFVNSNPNPNEKGPFIPVVGYRTKPAHFVGDGDEEKLTCNFLCSPQECSISDDGKYCVFGGESNEDRDEQEKLLMYILPEEGEELPAKINSFKKMHFRTGKDSKQDIRLVDFKKNDASSTTSVLQIATGSLSGQIKLYDIEKYSSDVWNLLPHKCSGRKQLPDINLLDLPMCIATSGSRQIRTFVQLALKFVHVNTDYFPEQGGWQKILPELCCEIESLSRLLKRLELIAEQNPNPVEWGVLFEEGNNWRYRSVLDIDKVWLLSRHLNGSDEDNEDEFHKTFERFISPRLLEFTEATMKNMGVPEELLVTLRRMCCALMVARYDLFVVEIFRALKKAIKKRLGDSDDHSILKILDMEVHIPKILGEEDKIKVNFMELLITSIHDSCFAISRPITRGHLTGIARQIVSHFLGDNAMAQKVLKSAVYIRQLIKGNNCSGRPIKEIPVNVSGSLYDLSRLIEDPNAKLCLEALCALLRRDALSGAFSPDLEKIKPLALALGGFEEDKLQAVINIVAKLSDIYGGISSFRELQEGAESITHDIAQQLAAGADSAKNAKLKDLKSLISSNSLANEDFVRALYQFIDVDGNGEVSFEEFNALLTHMRLDISREQAAILFAKFDKDGAGVIRASEFEFGFYHIEDVVVDMALRSMGITASEMTRLLLFGVFVLTLVSVFVFLGVSAFTTGTNFGAVINSFLPIISSTLLFKGDAAQAMARSMTELRSSAVQALNKIRVASVK